MEKGKMVAFTAEEAEYIAEALQDAIEDSNNMGTDNEVFNRAPRLRDLLNRVIDKYELPDPWSDRPDLDAMEKVKGMDPDQRSAADAGKISEPIEGKREKEVDQARNTWNAYMKDYHKRERERREEKARAEIDSAWDIFEDWKKEYTRLDGCEILQVSGPDRNHCWTSAQMDGNGHIGFCVAYTENGSEEIPAVAAMVVWIDTKNKSVTMEYEYDNPSFLVPAEILGILSPVPADSSAAMWRELNRRKLVDLSLFDLDYAR